MKFTTSCDSAASNAPSANGSASAPATHDLDAGQPRAARLHERLRRVRGGDVRRPEPLASAAVSAPGPQPTSSARICGSTPANSISAAAS